MARMAPIPPILLVVVVIVVGSAYPERERASLHHIQRPRPIGSRRSASLASRPGDPNSLRLREVCLHPQRPALSLPEQDVCSRMPATTYYRGCGVVPLGVPESASAVHVHLFESGRTPGLKVRRLEVSGDLGQYEPDPRAAQRGQAGPGAVDERP